MLNVKNVKNVIWDKDGTLIDVHIYWSEIIRRRANEIVKKYNLNYALYTDICKMLGLDVDNGRLLQEGPVGVLSRYEILEKLHIYLLDQGVNSNMNINELIFNVVHSEFKPFMYNYVKLLPCIKDTLDKFHQQGIRQYIITSDTSENAKSIADYLGIIKYFKKIWGKDEVRVPKKNRRACIEVNGRRKLRIKRNNLYRGY